jgi:L-rhamnose mutarotase
LLIGHAEATDFAATQKAMAATEVNQRWQAEMTDFFVDLDSRPDEGFMQLEEIFTLRINSNPENLITLSSR